VAITHDAAQRLVANAYIWVSIPLLAYCVVVAYRLGSRARHDGEDPLLAPRPGDLDPAVVPTPA
jgi:hypothetical protein